MDTTPASAPHTGTLLGVWAHPDDEAYLTAALMARARDAGHRVVVASATRGERGTTDARSWPPERLAALREHELVASLAVLGVHEHRWLDHHDGRLHQVRRSIAVDQVAGLIDEVRPDTIVTFGPDGMTGHLDHRTVSDWVTRAWDETGRASRLWYATVTPAFHERWDAVNQEVGLWFTGTRPPATDREDLAAEIVCDEDLLDRKHAALRAHASQTDELVTLLGEERFRRWWAIESFVATAEGSSAPFGGGSSRPAEQPSPFFLGR